MEDKVKEEDILKEDLPERLQKLRKALKLSQKEIAEKIGIKKLSWWRYENKERIPDIFIIYQLVNIFKVSPLWLLTGEGSMFLGEREEQGKVVNFEDKRLEQMFEYLRERWEKADLEGRRIIELEFSRAFHDYVEWLKKQKKIEEKAD